uniref:Thioredoxin family protein n=2 Tax=Rhizophora mucronata TaxID=61149 RepID=A0A2P2MI18_RHIMU
MAITSVSAASTVRSLNARHRQTANYSSSKLLSFSFSSLQLPVELRQVRLANGGLFSQSRSRISPLFAAKKQTFSTFDELLTNSDKPVFVEFYATWCGPCQFMNPILNEVSITLKDTVQVVKIDTEKYPSIANKYRIEALPTFILFKEGKPYDRFEGALTKDDLIERIENLLNVKQ